MSQFLLLEDVEKLAFDALTNPPEGIPLPWWNRMTELLGGLRMNEWSAITAATGAGKTTLLANLVCQTVLQGHGAYICSAEIGSAMFLVAMYSAMERRSLGGGEKYRELEIKELQKRYAKILRTARVLFSKHDDRIQPKELIAEIESAAKFGVKLVILDNLQFFTPIVESNRERQVMDETIREFSRLVRRLPVHCMLIVHPRKGDVENEHALKGSSTIPQEADNIMVMQRLDEPTLATKGFNPTDRKLTFYKIRRRGWNYGKSVFFEFLGGAYQEKNVDYGGR